MIQLYLLVLIIIFIGILYTIKEKFQDRGDFKCDDGIQRVMDWSNDNSDNKDGVYLYGCNAFSSNNDKTNSLSQISIKLFWNKSDVEPEKIILIVNTEDDDDTFMKEISPKELTYNTHTNIPQSPENPIKTYELIDNIIEGKTYFITINYIAKKVNDIQPIHVSNTLKITAISPVPHFKSSGFKLQQQNLMNLLRNKTFDIYL
jgi:hypothetical protein